MRSTALKFSVLIFFTVVALTACEKPPLVLQGAQMLPGQMALQEFTLKDHNGNTFAKTELAQHMGQRWGLVFFGYTYCPDICPLEMQKLGQMVKKLEEAKVEIPKVFFVSVDPERDSIDQMKQYATYFHPSFVGVTGENPELAKLAKSFAASYSRMAEIDGQKYLVKAGASMPEGSGENYSVNHTSRIFILNPQGQYVGSFAPPYSVDILYADMKQLIQSR